MTRSAGWAANCLVDDGGGTAFRILVELIRELDRGLGSLPYDCDDRVGLDVSS